MKKSKPTPDCLIDELLSRFKHGMCYAKVNPSMEDLLENIYIDHMHRAYHQGVCDGAPGTDENCPD